MNQLALYCKSYSTDLRRVARLMQSDRALQRDTDTRLLISARVLN